MSKKKTSRAKAQCSVDGCNRDTRCRGLCPAHYSRLQKHGDPLVGWTHLITKTASAGEPERFFREVVLTWDDPEQCLIWPFGTMKYPQYWVGDKHWNVHRLVCIEKHGPPPFKGAQACHDPIKCNDSRCVNWMHISWKTSADNNGHDKELAGTVLRGERHPSSKLTATQIQQIRRATTPYTLLAHRFRVSRSLIGLIRQGLRWKHIPPRRRTKKRARQG
jgi:hypothetical protein